MKLFVIINQYIKDISIIRNYLNSTNFHITYFEYSSDLSEYVKLINLLNKDSNIRVIVVTTNGIGEFLLTNKIHLLRAATVIDEFTAKSVVAHNNAQVIILPLAIISSDYAIKLTDIFLNSAYEGGRHDIRINILNKLSE